MDCNYLGVVSVFVGGVGETDSLTLRGSVAVGSLNDESSVLGKTNIISILL